MFFNTWLALLRVLVVGTLAYVGLVFFLRISGKRTLSKMNAFDLIVTVALGSTLATTLLSKDVALAAGLAAFALLIGLQYILTWLAVRSDRFQRLIKAQPRLLAYDGRLHEGAMKEERVTHEEMAAAIRESGVPGLRAAQAVVMETDGSLTVIPHSDEVDVYGSLEHVRGLPDEVAERVR